MVKKYTEEILQKYNERKIMPVCANIPTSLTSIFPISDNSGSMLNQMISNHVVGQL